MQYHSPFHLLPKNITDGIPDQSTLRKAKKRLLAEFELQQTTTIPLNNREVDRNTVLQIFDQLEDERFFRHHQLLFKEKGLLDFLEQGDTAVFAQEELLEKLFQDEEFVQFVQPYFIERLNFSLYKALKNRDLLLLQQLSDIPVLPEPAFEATAYQKAYRHQKNALTDFRNLIQTSKEYYISDSIFLEYFDFEQIRLWNALPDYFSRPRTFFALVLEDVAVNLHNNSRRSTLGAFALEQGMRLKIDLDTKNRLDYLHQQIKKNGGKVKEKNLEESKADHLLFFALLLLGQAIILLLAID